MAIEDTIASWFEDGEKRGQALRWSWRISLGFLLFGYGVMVYTLFW